MHFFPFASPSCSAAGALSRRRSGEAGIALVQVLMAMGMITLCGAGALRALVEINHKAAAMRTLNSARAIVQRNIDTALGIPFSSTQVPPILAFTAAGGTVYVDDGSTDNKVTVVQSRSGSANLVRGTLTRTVTAETNADNADIRRVTFRIDYTYARKGYSFSLTSLRAVD